jgi:hypothetical protein
MKVMFRLHDELRRQLDRNNLESKLFLQNPTDRIFFFRNAPCQNTKLCSSGTQENKQILKQRIHRDELVIDKHSMDLAFKNFWMLHNLK